MSGEFWVIQKLTHGQTLMKLFSTQQLVLSTAVWPFPTVPSVCLSLRLSSCCYPCLQCSCHTYSTLSYPSRPKLNSSTSIIFSLMSQSIISFPWIPCFFNTIQSVTPIIICIIIIFLYVVRLPIIVWVTKGRTTSLHPHLRL